MTLRILELAEEVAIGEDTVNPELLAVGRLQVHEIPQDYFEKLSSIESREDETWNRILLRDQCFPISRGEKEEFNDELKVVCGPGLDNDQTKRIHVDTVENIGQGLANPFDQHCFRIQAEVRSKISLGDRGGNVEEIIQKLVQNFAWRFGSSGCTAVRTAVGAESESVKASKWRWMWYEPREAADRPQDYHLEAQRIASTRTCQRGCAREIRQVCAQGTVGGGLRRSRRRGEARDGVQTQRDSVQTTGSEVDPLRYPSRAGRAFVAHQKLARGRTHARVGGRRSSLISMAQCPRAHHRDADDTKDWHFELRPQFVEERG
ncbi:hypothetical protein C8R45DRAFT_1186233 [Mycena sanguinolenta]|nr:hypothetical protein C8R45DRAFT_1186233 [Mycena sanguinolenta]